MPLHPEIEKFLQSLPKKDPNEKITPEGQRKILNVPLIPEEERVPVYKIEDRTIPGPEVDIPVRIYTPHEEGPYSLLMYFHGGGFIAGTIESHDPIVREIAVASGYKVISVGYRLAPEHPFPAAVMDCYNATKWVAENYSEINGDGKNLAVAGDSAGGNLAAAVSLLARERKEFTITKQALFYPSLDLDVSEFRYPSLIENAEGNGLESKELADYYVHYIKGDASPNDPLASPVKAKDFSNLPEALVITCEMDPLRDEGEYYAKKLKEAGVPVELKRYEGANHGFLGQWTHLEEFSDVYERIGQFLKRNI